MKVFGRDPALWIALFAGGLELFSTYVLHFSTELQGTVTAVVVMLFGLWTAAHLPNWGDKILPAILGLAQAIFALALAFGADIPATTQGQWMSFIALLVGAFVRTQVTAPVGNQGEKRLPASHD
jgi:hypothetical protein